MTNALNLAATNSVTNSRSNQTPNNDWYRRVAALSEEQRLHLAQALQQQLGAKKIQRLVAYAVPAAHTSVLDPLALRHHLKESLPPYMVPAVVVPLPALPRTANGKIDVRALPEPDASNAFSPSKDAVTRPTTPVEESLCRIWQRVLQVEPIGIHDNFFELGGDSILSIQIVSQAREAGLRLAPNQLFEQPTIAELAAVVNQIAEVEATQAPVTGPVPLTPIQHWFFDQEMARPQHWHQGRLLALPPSVSREQVDRAIAKLWHHHDALRLRFRFSPDERRWQQINGEISEPPDVVRVDLTGLDAKEQRARVKAQGDQLHAGLDLAQGPAFQAAHFIRGFHSPSWLLVSVHHLVIDAVSWQILRDDLRTLLNPVNPSALPAKTTAFKVWAETLASQAKRRASELDFWLAQLAPPQVRLPRDVSNVSQPTEGDANTLTVELEASATRSLLQAVPAVYNTQINDVLFTALTYTLLRWAGDADVKNAAHSLRIDIEAHGRETAGLEVDLSRTVGWFTATYPVKLQVDIDSPFGESLKTIKEQLRQIPNRGIGYGLLRYLGDETVQQQLAQFPASEVLFNYLGQHDLGQSVSATDNVHKDKRQDVSVNKQQILAIQDLDLGVMRDPSNRRGYLLEINAWVASGQLNLNWTYDTQCYQAETISGLANTYLANLRAIISHCLQVEHGGFTPSDFPDVSLSQSELDELVARLSPATGNIEAIYPLSSLQQAFLWNSLRDSSQAGLLQMRGTLHSEPGSELDAAVLKQAWGFVTRTHASLRSSVHWEGLLQPVHMTMRQVALPWQQVDWRSHDNPQEKLAAFLADDRAVGFDFTQAPIMRLALIQLGDHKHELVWSCHHLMLDGWSGQLVINQVLETYEALMRGEWIQPRPALSHQAYVGWLRDQNGTEAERFWRETMKGFTAPTPLPSGLTLSQEACTEQRQLALSAELSAALAAFLKSHQLTLNTLIQGVWALLLSVYSGQPDVVFGATVSGRQGNLPGVASVVGLLINVLPVRVTLAADESVLDGLRSLQTAQARASQYAYASSSQMQTWSDCQSRLFNSLLVVENYPAGKTESDTVQSKPTLRLENLRSGIISTYGLTLIVKPGDVLTLFAEAKTARPQSLDALLNDFKTLLNTVVSSPTLSVHQLLHEASIAPFPSSPSKIVPAVNQRSAQIPVEDNTDSELLRTPAELKLAKIWAFVLGVSALDGEANFFELGGDSLLAVQLFNQIQQQFNCSLPLASLFQAPTIRQLAALLSQQTSLKAWSSLVPIQSEGSRLPFFFHGGSADALTWARFSQLLGTNQPFYALQRPDLDSHEVTDTSVEALAATCIRDIKTVQPEGPYVVGGHCFGGAVAYEIARQLQTQGDAIASLIQVDAYCPNALPHSRLSNLQEQLQLTTFLIRKAYYYHGGRNLLHLPKKVWQRLAAQRLDAAVDSSASPSPRRHTAHSSNSASSPTPQSLPPETVRFQSPLMPYEARYAQAHQANIRAAERYHPKPLIDNTPELIALFRAGTQILDWRYGPALGWQTLTADPVKIVTVPGLFGNLFNQRSGPLLAQQVKVHLDTLS